VTEDSDLISAGQKCKVLLCTDEENREDEYLRKKRANLAQVVLESH
jgi:hypothetical protein